MQKVNSTTFERQAFEHSLMNDLKAAVQVIVENKLQKEWTKKREKIAVEHGEIRLEECSCFSDPDLARLEIPASLRRRV